MPAATIIEETHVNETEGYMLGEPIRIALEDTFLGADATPGDIYRFALGEYGRCVSKVYVDAEGGPKAIGWVFQKRDHYEDTGEPFIHETWVTLLTRYEERVERDYAEVTR